MVGTYGWSWQWRYACACVYLINGAALCVAQTPVRDLEQWSDSAYEQYQYLGALDRQQVDSVLYLYPPGTVTEGKKKLNRMLAASYDRSETGRDLSRPYLIPVRKNKKNQPDSLKLGLILAGMGESYRASGQLNKADSVLQLSLKIFTRYKDSLGIAYTHGRYTSVLLERGVLDTARILPHYRMASAYYPGLRHRREIGGEMGAYANTLWEAGRKEEAIQVLQQAVHMPLDSASLCSLYNIIARVYKSNRQYDSALLYAQRAYRTSTRKDLNGLAMDAALIVRETYDSLANYKSAYDWSLIYSALLGKSHNGIQGEDARITELEREADKQRMENELLRREYEKHEEDVARFRWFVILISVLAAILVAVAIYLLRQRKGLREAQAALRGSNLKIEEQNAELKKYLKVRDRLISVASHDLRAPLATVKNLLELFSNDRLTQDELRGLVTMLEAQYQRSLDMADNLLLWAKSQLEGIEAKATTFDLMEMTEDVLNFSKPVIESSGVKVQLSNKGEARAFADVEMSKFVIRNLLHNAIKFSDAGDVISIDIVRDNGVVRWCIEDEGPGMSKAQIDELFRVGSKIDSKDPKKGAGIGLYLSHYFAELNEGQLLAWSEIGKGSTFCFELKSISAAPVAN